MIVIGALNIGGFSLEESCQHFSLSLISIIQGIISIGSTISILCFCLTLAFHCILLSSYMIHGIKYITSGTISLS